MRSNTISQNYTASSFETHHRVGHTITQTGSRVGRDFSCSFYHTEGVSGRPLLRFASLKVGVSSIFRESLL